MDFDGAIKAHSDWKMKLSNYIRKPDKSLKPEVVGQDNQCVLGKWIYSEGISYKSYPEYEELRQAHAKFHSCASEVIKKADAGQSVAEEVALGSQSEYSKISSHVIQLIMRMKAKLTKAA